MSVLPANHVSALLDEREAALIEKFREVREQHPTEMAMIVHLPAQAMLGDEQREAIQSAVEAVFAALAAVAR